MAIPRRYALLTEMRLEQAQANYVRKLLLTASRQVQSDLNKLGDSGNPMTRMQLEAQKASLSAMMDRAYVDIEKAVREGQIDAAKAASQVVSRYENQLLKMVADPAAMKRIAAGEAQRAVNNLNAAMKRIQGTSYNPLSKQVYKTAKLSKGWLDDKINQALVSGWDAKRLAKEVVGSINPDVPGGVSYAANRLARTEINNAYHAASYDRYLKSAIVEEVEWLLSSSHPEDDVCNDYAKESPFKKNAVPAKPHPHCYCYITPRLPTEEEFIAKMMAGEYGDEPWSQQLSPIRTAAAIRKTAAKPVAKAVKKAKPPLPSVDMKKLPKLSYIDELEEVEDISREFAKVYGGRSYNGFTITDVTADYAEDGIGVQMRIRAADGGDAGFATRIFRDDGTVFHDTLELAAQYRGKGFGTAFSNFSEDYYRANGIKSINLEAALDDGGYTWAKAGYSWDPKVYSGTRRPEGVIENLRSVRNSVDAQSKKTLDELIDRMSKGDVSAWPAPSEIANLPGSVNGVNLGRAILNGSDWYGVKPL